MRLTIDVRKRLLAVVLVLTGFSTLPAVELGLRAGQDGLFATGQDSTVSPVLLLAEADFGLSRALVLRAQAGYCLYRDMDFDVGENSSHSASVDGVRAAVVPLACLRTPLDWLVLRGGLGLGLSYSHFEAREDEYYPQSTRSELATRDALSGNQSFVGEASCELSRRLALLVGVERPGFRAMVSDSTYESWRLMTVHVGRLVTGWDKYARSTVSAALHYRL